MVPKWCQEYGICFFLTEMEIHVMKLFLKDTVRSEKYNELYPVSNKKVDVHRLTN